MTEPLSCFCKRFTVTDTEKGKIICCICDRSIEVNEDYTFAGQDYLNYKTICLDCTQHIARHYITLELRW